MRVSLAPGEPNPMPPKGEANAGELLGIDIKTGFDNAKIAQNEKVLEIAKKYVPGLENIINDRKFAFAVRQHPNPFFYLSQLIGHPPNLLGYTESPSFLLVSMNKMVPKQVLMLVVIQQNIYESNAELIAIFVHEMCHAVRYAPHYNEMVNGSYRIDRRTEELLTFQDEISNLERLIKDESKQLNLLDEATLQALKEIVERDREKLSNPEKI